MADRENYDPEQRRRCTGRTRTGARCSKYAIAGTDRCAHHTFRVPGRPRKISPEITDRVVDTLLDGNYLETAAAVAGISKATLYRWLRMAEELEARALELVDDDDPNADIYSHVDPREWPLLDFRHAVKSAEAWAEAELVRNVRRAGLGWQAFATLLERRHPSRWGRRKTFEVGDSDYATGAGRLELVVPPDEDRRHAVAELLSATGALDEDAPDENT